MASRFDNTNVVRLPTAAPRKVQQPHNKAGREARQALREASPWPGEYVFPCVRNAMPIAETLLRADRTPALVLATAIVQVLDEDTRLRVIGALARHGNVEGVREALAVVRATELTVGEMYNLCQAMDYLRERSSADAD